MERITVDVISSKEFAIETRGYNRKEVDEFLDEVCDEMERMEAEIKDLRQKTTVVHETPAAPAVAVGVSAEDESSFREILEMAQQVKNETLKKAREDAEAIRAKAEAEATERLDGINEERDAISRELEELKAAATKYRESFEALLQAQQEALDKAAPDLF